MLFNLYCELKRAEPLVVPLYDFGAHPSALLVYSAFTFPLSKTHHAVCRGKIDDKQTNGTRSGYPKAYDGTPRGDIRLSSQLK